MSRLLLLILGLIYIGIINAQLPQFWSCPDHPVVQNFDMSRYAGMWYEQERAFTWSEAGTRCVSANYTPLADGRIHVENEQINRVTNVKRAILGEIKLAGKLGEGRLSVTYPTVLLPIETTYSILDTDYKSYSVVWSCFNMGIANMQNIWLMTRERLPAGTTLQKAYGVLDRLKIPHNYLVKTIQEDCEIVDTEKPVQPAQPPTLSASSSSGVLADSPTSGDSVRAAEPAAEASPSPAKEESTEQISTTPVVEQANIQGRTWNF